MKKILYVDYDLQVGHINFNRIQIDALVLSGADVHLVLHKFMYDRLPYPREMYDWVIPPILRYRDGHPLVNRIVFLITLILIKLKLNLRSYDHIVVGFCDEISLGIVKLSKGMYIFMHRIVSVRESRIKRFFCRHLARHSTFLVFNQHMADMLQESGIDRYHIISHGCVEPFENLPNVESCHPFTIIHPSAKLNPKFVKEILHDTGLHEYLSSHNIRILLKECAGIPRVVHSNIIYLPTHIDFEDYKQYFTNADAVLLSYPNDFCGQVSGVSYECVANHKRLLVYNHLSLIYCREYYNYDPIFNSTGQLTRLLTNLMTDSSLQCSVSPDDLRPDYSFLK